jgi:alpha-tubulin suppressor-like RCC1 family protein
VVAWSSNNPTLNSTITNVPSNLTNVVAIAAGATHTLALKGDGTVVAWGVNSNGETSVPTGLTNVAAIAAGESHSLALLSNGMVVAWGGTNYGQTHIYFGLWASGKIFASCAWNSFYSGNGARYPQMVGDPFTKE